MEHTIESAFRAGFLAGFDVTREGFNGECAYAHCAPSPFCDAEYPERAAEDAAYAEFTRSSLHTPGTEAPPTL